MRPHCCPYNCGKVYRHRSSVNRHIRIYHQKVVRYDQNEASSTVWGDIFLEESMEKGFKSSVSLEQVSRQESQRNTANVLQASKKKLEGFSCEQS